MAGFNTFPVKTASSSATDSTITVTGQLLPPQLVRENYATAARFANQQQSNRFEGFNGDGDYVELPIAAGNSLAYFNSSDASQFTVARTTIAAASDDWVGFTFDSVDNLIYVVVVDEGTTPNTYFLASVNVSGTVVNIGNAQPGTDFVTTTTSWYHSSPQSTGGTTIQRAADGTGNMFVRQTNSVGGMQEMEVNISTGAIVSVPTVINGNIVDIAWQAASGNYFSIDNATSQRFYNATTKILFVPNVDPQVFGWFTLASQKMIQWKGRMVATSTTSSAFVSQRNTSTIAVFDTWIDNVITTYGMA